MKKDLMLLATFLSTLFYSASYPLIYKEITMTVTTSMISLNQIFNCISIVLFSSLWNKRGDNLFKFYPLLLLLECLCCISVTIYTILTGNIIGYYILDTLMICCITRNIICGGNKLRAKRYNSEKERETFDNNNNSASAIATIIGSLIAIILKLDINSMLIIATIGNSIDNILYALCFREEAKRNLNN